MVILRIILVLPLDSDLLPFLCPLLNFLLLFQGFQLIDDFLLIVKGINFLDIIRSRVFELEGSMLMLKQLNATKHGSISMQE